MKKELPVLQIGHFRSGEERSDFYAELFRIHLKDHPIASKPHKHDFFLVVLFTKGTGTHEIDFTRYPVVPGSLFLLSPGQSHQWTLSKDVDGIIFFHTGYFFDKGVVGKKLRDYPFFNSIYNSPLLQLETKQMTGPLALFHEILKEYRDSRPLRKEKLLTLLNLLYIDLTRLYVSHTLIKSESYLAKLRQFEDLLELEFKKVKLPSYYADKMHITERHLNRICKICLDKTPTGLILDRNILEAKRLLLGSSASVAVVASELGYDDQSYFSRLFKKGTGQTPSEFAGKYH